MITTELVLFLILRFLNALWVSMLVGFACALVGVILHRIAEPFVEKFLTWREKQMLENRLRKYRAERKKLDTWKGDIDDG